MLGNSRVKQVSHLIYNKAKGGLKYSSHNQVQRLINHPGIGTATLKGMQVCVKFKQIKQTACNLQMKKLLDLVQHRALST